MNEFKLIYETNIYCCCCISYIFLQNNKILNKVTCCCLQSFFYPHSGFLWKNVVLIRISFEMQTTTGRTEMFKMILFNKFMSSLNILKKFHFKIIKLFQEHFKTIDNDILLQKLMMHWMEYKELMWFRSYLSNRKQIKFKYLVSQVTILYYVQTGNFIKTIFVKFVRNILSVQTHNIRNIFLTAGQQNSWLFQQHCFYFGRENKF